MKEKIEEISLSMERGHRRILRVLGALLAVGLFVLLWKWRGPAALEPLIDGGMRRWTCAVLESIVITLAAQWVLCLLPWPLLALFGRTAPFCSVFSLRPCVGSKAELSRAAMIAVRSGLRQWPASAASARRSAWCMTLCACCRSRGGQRSAT